LGNSTVCPDSAITLSPNGGPYQSYFWNPNGEITSTLTTSTVGTYSVKVNNGNCFYTSNSVTLSNFSVIQPSAHSDVTVCEGTAVTLTSDPGYTNIVWTPSGLTGPSISVTTPGAYTYKAIDVNGCPVTSTSATITNKPNPVITLTQAPKPLCVGQTTATIDAGSQVGVSYTWGPGGETTPTITVSSAGTISVTADLNGCVKTDVINVTESRPPSIELGNAKTSCCTDITLNPDADKTLFYKWSTGDTTGSLVVKGGNTSNTTYSLTVTSTDGCTATDVDTAVIWCIKARATATPDTIRLYPGPIQTSTLNASTDYSSVFYYTWTPVANLSPTTGQSVVSSTIETTTYKVVIVDSATGCVDSARIELVVIEPDIIAMPTAFSPNGDGNNDKYFPVFFNGHAQTDVKEFRVYNRWGQIIYDNPMEGWDGKFKGEDQPVEIYTYFIYVLVPDQVNPGVKKEIRKSGSFSLMR